MRSLRKTPPIPESSKLCDICDIQHPNYCESLIPATKNKRHFSAGRTDGRTTDRPAGPASALLFCAGLPAHSFLFLYLGARSGSPVFRFILFLYRTTLLRPDQKGPGLPVFQPVFFTGPNVLTESTGRVEPGFCSQYHGLGWVGSGHPDLTRQHGTRSDPTRPASLFN